MKNNTIVTLKGPDRVRKRPAVIFLSDGIEGAQNAVRGIMDIFVTEARLGRCKHLNVRQTGGDLVISGDDRGLYLGQDSRDDAVWENIFCRMHVLPAGRPDESNYTLGLWDHAHHTLYGDEPAPNSIYYPEDIGFFDLCAVQYASAYMDVTTIRDGIRSRLQFRQGHPVHPIHHEPTADPSGTCFRFALDPAVFRETVLPASFFTDTLKRFAMLAPGLFCTYYSGETGQQEIFYFPGGSADYAQRHTAAGLPVYSKRIQAKGKDRYDRAQYEACVELVIGYTPSQAEALCLHNFRELSCGGTHYTQVQNQICRALQDCFHSDFSDDPWAFQELSRHLTIILATWCSPYCSAWENGSRLSITNRMITDMAYDAAGKDLRDYVYAHKAQLRPMIDAILKARQQA